jgi:predicted ribonuclease YlaK
VDDELGFFGAHVRHLKFPCNGPGTKVVCLGNIVQIDTPYLTEGSSGLIYVVDRFKGWQHSSHITLQRGWRIMRRRS